MVNPLLLLLQPLFNFLEVHRGIVFKQEGLTLKGIKLGREVQEGLLKVFHINLIVVNTLFLLEGSSLRTWRVGEIKYFGHFFTEVNQHFGGGLDQTPVDGLALPFLGHESQDRVKEPLLSRQIKYVIGLVDQIKESQ